MIFNSLHVQIHIILTGFYMRKQVTALAETQIESHLKALETSKVLPHSSKI